MCAPQEARGPCAGSVATRSLHADNASRADAPARVGHRGAPQLGEQTLEVLGELGYPPKRINAFCWKLAW